MMFPKQGAASRCRFGGMFRRYGVALVLGAAVLWIGGYLVALGYHTWPVADDYCNIVSVDRRGVFGALADLWFQWSGRLGSSLVLYGLFGLIPFGLLHWASALAGASVLVLAGLILRLTGPWAPPMRWPALLVILQLLVFCAFALLGQTVFWVTGWVVYHVALLYFVGWLCFLSRDMKQAGNPSVAATALRFGAAIVAGNLMELLWMPAIACLLSLWRRAGPARPLDASHPLLPSILGWGVGACILAAAPGNYARAGATAGSFSIDMADKVLTYGAMLQTAFLSGHGWMLSLILVLALIALCVPGVPGRAQFVTRRDGPSARALLVGGLLSVAPMLAVPGQIAPRNGYFLVVFVVAAGVAAWREVLSGAHSANNAGRVLLIVAVLGTCLLTPVLGQALDRQRDAYAMLEARHEHMLSAAAGASGVVSVAPVDYQRIPGTVHFMELAVTPEGYPNTCVASVLGLPGVVLSADSH